MMILMRGQGRECRLFIRMHQTAVALNVRRKDRSQLPLRERRGTRQLPQGRACASASKGRNGRAGTSTRLRSDGALLRMPDASTVREIADGERTPGITARSRCPLEY